MTLPNVGLCAFTFAWVLALAGCQTGPKPEGKKDVAADTAEINAIRGKFSTAFNSNDAGGLAALYADDAVVMLTNQPAIEGRPAIQSMYEAMFKANTAKIAITTLETQVGGDWAFDRGNSTTTVTPKSGTPVEEAEKYLVLLKREPGGLWKVYRQIANSNNPPPNAPSTKAGKKAVKKAAKKKR
jgi:uncharacterized protein (TIGR02246 family)